MKHLYLVSIATRRTVHSVRYKIILVPGRPFYIFISNLDGLLTMYLLYLDESGNPNGWQEQKNFVLGGVAIHEGQIYGLSKQLDAIQEKYFPGILISINFHATDIRRGKGHFKDFTPDTRDQILRDVYSVIHNSRFPNLVAFATVMNISAVQNAMQVRRETLEDVCLRFNTFLIRFAKAGTPTKGLLIIDRHREDEYRQLIGDFQNSGTKAGYIGNIVDIPYFARCHMTRMLQLADFCVNAVFRFYERNDSRYFDMIQPRFDRRHKNHPPDGLKHITNEPCSCIACAWR